MQIDQARRYIGAIRNPAKRGYAEHYWAWLVDSIVTSRDVHPPEPSNLSTMAAQAVRMNLRSYTDGRAP